MKQRVVDVKKHFVFVRVAKINKKIFIPNFINDLMALPLWKVLIQDSSNG